MPSPDPIVSASVYCRGQLDAVIHGALAPMLEELRRAEAEGEWGLWWVRYSRRGEHLKVRVHGPAAEQERVRARLADAVDGVLASLAPAAEQPPAKGGELPAIDPEDEGRDDHPDRSLLWTAYRRSHVSLGPLFLDDDDYVRRITGCLARGAELVIDGIPWEPGCPVPAPARQRTLLKAMIAALAAPGFTPERRAEYLAYHRRWLLQFSAGDQAEEEALLATFERQREAMERAVEQIGELARDRWAPASHADPPELAWRDAVADLLAYAEPQGQAALADPFASDPAFPLVFKALHGTANQVGLSNRNEAFLHHLLLAAAESAAVDGIPVEA